MKFFRWFYNLLCVIIPETRFFRLKSALLRCGEHTVHPTARICSSVRFYGVSSISIGFNSWIGHDVLIVHSDKVLIGNNVDIGPRVFIGTGTHEIDPIRANTAGAGRSLPIHIEDGVWIGAGAIILPGVTIGQKAMIAAGAVVTKNIPPFALAAGVPAKIIRDIRSSPPA